VETDPKYQLVLQFTAEESTDFDELVAVEEKLVEHLNGLALVDGRDFGMTEFNIFVLTDNPAEAFERAQSVIRNEPVRYNMRAAYRLIHSEGNVILWPPNLAEFSVA
jgi:hypothetical protein